MATIRKTVSGLKPDSNYLFAVKPKNTEISASDSIPDSIRIKTPPSGSVPSPIDINFFNIYCNFESVMFVFKPVTDQDFSEYEYEIYDDSTTPALVSTGRKRSTVFVISVANTNRTVDPLTNEETIEYKKYYGRVRAINTSGVGGDWTPLVTHSGNTPLIEDQYIGSLTAAKITAGVMNAEQIILKNASGPIESYTPSSGVSVIRSSNYIEGELGVGQGWIIKGDGTAQFDAASIRGTLSANSIFIDANNRWARNSANTASNLEFVVGNATNQLYWNPTGGTGGQSLLKVGNSTNYIQWNNNTLTVTGAITTGANISNSTAGGIAIGSSSLYFGTGTYANSNTPFYVDTSSRFSLGDKLYYEVVGGTTPTLTVNGVINASGGSFSGSITATGTITGGTLNGAVIQNAATSPTFKVDTSGNVFANNIYATGLTGGNDGGLQIRADGSLSGGTNGNIFIYHGRPESTTTYSIRLGGPTALVNGVPANYQYFSINQLVGQTQGPSNVTRLESSTNAIQIDSSFVGIGGRPSSSRTLFVHGDIILGEGSDNYDLLSKDFSGTRTASNVGARIDDSSSAGYRYLADPGSLRELKENIQDISVSEAYNIIKTLRPRKFTWKPSEEDTEYTSQLRRIDIDYGFIAEEVEESNKPLAIYKISEQMIQEWPNINDDMVNEMKLKYYKKETFLPIMMKVVQDLINRIEFLESQLAAQ